VPLGAERLDLAFLRVLRHHGHRVEHHLHLAAEHARARVAAALVRHVHDVDAGHRLEELAGHVVRRAGPDDA
jgi:hypothetical protein